MISNDNGGNGFRFLESQLCSRVYYEDDENGNMSLIFIVFKNQLYSNDWQFKEVLYELTTTQSLSC